MIAVGLMVLLATFRRAICMVADGLRVAIQLAVGVYSVFWMLFIQSVSARMAKVYDGRNWSLLTTRSCTFAGALQKFWLRIQRWVAARWCTCLWEKIVFPVWMFQRDGARGSILQVACSIKYKDALHPHTLHLDSCAAETIVGMGVLTKLPKSELKDGPPLKFHSLGGKTISSKRVLLDVYLNDATRFRVWCAVVETFEGDILLSKSDMEKLRCVAYFDPEGTVEGF